MRRWMAAAAAAVGVFLGSATVEAQTTTRPAYATQEFADWTFAPVLVDGEVKGFFCYINPNLLVGNNIPLVWYDKGADGEWTMWGWSNYNLAGAVKWLHDHYGSAEIFKNHSELCCVVRADIEGSEPKNMTEGLYTDDPMHQLIEVSDDPVEVMTLLEEIGWEAAPGLSQIAVAPLDLSCDPEGIDPLKKLLDESAYKMEVIITGVAATSVDCFSFGCTGCVKNYDPMVPDPNGQWIFRYHSTPASFPDDKFCYYDFPATQHWWYSGQKVSCGECTGSGTDSTFIMKTVRVGRNEDCRPPSGTP
ncbi:MAG TPA: hypothetical protein VD997_17265 [Phycisphaerales bacterium]|nr:hypothetical protein [Phycisphaerales bacterium]